MAEEIYCNIDRKWVGIAEHKIIPPDVIATVGDCGHALPVWADVRTVDEPELAKPKFTLPPTIEPTPQPAPDDTAAADAQAESDMEHSA